MKTKRPVSTKGGVWQKLLDALTEKQGELVLNEKLIEVSGQHNYARRVRELRAEGWDVVYDSKRKGYVLRSDKKIAKEADKYINLKLRQKVLERDNYTCQMCGHRAKDKYADGETVRLEVDHIIPPHQKGITAEDNLWTLCSRCNAGKKSLLAYPETLKNKIITLNLSDALRSQLSELALRNGQSINSVVIDLLIRSLQDGK